MATLNFPDNPSTGDTYFDTNAGFNYEWNGTVWITKDLPRPNNTKSIDDISSGFDGSDTTFTLQVDGVNIEPESINELVIAVGGVLQNPGDDYTLSGSTLSFTTAPSSSLTFYGTYVASAQSINTLSAGSVSPSSFTTTSNYRVDSINVSGASTIGNFVLTGLTTITDPDLTYLNNSGVGTVSNVILTQDNSGLGATIGAAVGVVTYYGDGSNLTGVGLTIFPLSYSPGIGSTSQLKSTDITTTWNYPIQAGSGTITIRTGSGSGTVVDQFVVGTSNSITISGRSLTLNPAADLGYETEYFVVYPAGVIKSSSGQKENNELITSFTTKELIYQMWGWGANEKGGIGINDIVEKSSPVQVPGLDWTILANGLSNEVTGATKATGTLYLWGQNDYGTLGQNQAPAQLAGLSSPTQVGTDTTWGYAALGNNNAYVTKTDGTLWAWGYNDYGTSGQNDRVARSSPAQIPGTTWKNTATAVNGGSHMWALKTDGTLWGMGRNEYGELGQNEVATSYSSPVQISGTTWTTVSGTGGSRPFVTKTDGSLWAWGYQEYGELGLNQHNVLQSSPCQIGTNTNWSGDIGKIGGDGNAMMAVKTDGTLWAWGRNDSSGQLGQNDRTNRSSPVQIPGTTWSTVNSAAVGVVHATKTDGTLWVWGRDGYGVGHLGLNQQSGAYSSPTQIGEDTGWIRATGGHRTTSIFKEV